MVFLISHMPVFALPNYWVTYDTILIGNLVSPNKWVLFFHSIPFLPSILPSLDHSRNILHSSVSLSLFSLSFARTRHLLLLRHFTGQAKAPSDSSDSLNVSPISSVQKEGEENAHPASLHSLLCAALLVECGSGCGGSCPSPPTYLPSLLDGERRSFTHPTARQWGISPGQVGCLL